MEEYETVVIVRFAKSIRLLKRLRNRKVLVVALKLKISDLFASGSYDKTIKIWDSGSFICLLT